MQESSATCRKDISKISVTTGLNPASAKSLSKIPSKTGKGVLLHLTITSQRRLTPSRPNQCKLGSELPRVTLSTLGRVLLQACDA